MELHAIGIDLGKTVFHLVGLDSRGKVVARKRCFRTQLLAYTANVQVGDSTDGLALALNERRCGMSAYWHPGAFSVPCQSRSFPNAG